MNDYFTDRESGSRPRTSEVIDERVWRGIKSYVQSRIDDGSFGETFPDTCPDGTAVCGSDERAFRDALYLHVPDIQASFEVARLEEVPAPQTPAILDLIEFCYRRVAKPEAHYFHSFFSHHHFSFDQGTGRSEFREEINTIFARNGIAFELYEDGTIQRLGPPIVGDWLRAATFRTGDDELDRMLEEARRDFLSPTLGERKRGLEKLWDAYERIKTLENPNKREGTRIILDTAGEGRLVYRQHLENDARALTEIGNNLMIRHHEITKEPIPDADQVDYLFARAVSLIRLLLKKTGRGG